ncbi:MAG: MerC domain-containing protein [Erythrobacter sp.]|uniref:MerC domain-containing protein n=1 Tax=Erythrobacter sp. TaxID=1042 RepID=UPI00261AFE9E|nr:MerC domain-containing protein [Erythrobacter sp.]MDJ0979011.1 MerC domain-containing protein [Erythrobacter sp.]
MTTSQRTTTSPVRSQTDRAAVFLSLACIAHCVALPMVAVALPFAAAAAEAEWVHWVFAVLAILASGTVALTDPAARVANFLVPAGLGAALVVFGLFSEGLGIEEAIPTVIGGVLLAFAHGRRLTRRAVQV